MNVLALFAKYWQPGAVKTRMASQWGDATAARLHRVFLECLLKRLDHIGDERWLVFTPGESHAAFAELADENWRLCEQAPGDLGQRMAACFRDAFLAGATRVVLLGADSPNLPRSHIQQAFELLDHHQVVLGPAADGGYCLVGARDNGPPIFADIAWSTNRVYAQTIERLHFAGMAYACLPPWYDVDTPDDLERLRGDLKTAADANLCELRDRIELSLRPNPSTASP